MTAQEQEIFHEMLAALQDVVNWYGAPTQCACNRPSQAGACESRSLRPRTPDDRRLTPLAQFQSTGARRRLYLMACDAYGRGDPKIAEVFIQANQYADQAAGLRSDGDQRTSAAPHSSRRAASLTRRLSVASIACVLR
jgi:hypothetical protein